MFPGTALELGDGESKIPVILIQRPGVTSDTTIGHDPCPGHGSGWDLLLPEAWGMPFWLAMVFRGARCGGLLEQECSVYEEKSLLFPNNFPDTDACLKHQSEVEDGFLAKFNRTPPAKRPNFTKLGVSFPYNTPWKLLTEYWKSSATSVCPVDGNKNVVKDSNNQIIKKVNDKQKEGCEEMQCDDGEKKAQKTDKQEQDNMGERQDSVVDRNYFVMRNYKILRHLHSESLEKTAKHRGKKFSTDNSLLAQIETSCETALVPVRLELKLRGVVKEFAMICIPTADDITALVKDKHYSGPMEPKHVDPKLVQKKKLKQEMKEKKVKKKVRIDRSLRKVVDSPDLSLDSCSRKVIGFVCAGGYSMGTGIGGGVGFVSLKGLLSMIRDIKTPNYKWTVLIRNTTSLQYRYARISVLL